MAALPAGTPVFSGGYGQYRRSLILQMASAEFTPYQTGFDYGSLKYIPYDPSVDNNGLSMVWTVVSITCRLEAAASAGTTSIQIGRSTTSGVFTNVGYLNTSPLSLTSGVYEAVQFTAALTVTQVNSGDKIMANFTSLGTNIAGVTLQMVLRG